MTTEPRKIDLNAIASKIDKLENAIRLINESQTIIDDALSELGPDPCQALIQLRNDVGLCWSGLDADAVQPLNRYCRWDEQNECQTFPEADTDEHAARARLVHELSRRLDHLKSVLAPRPGGWNPSRTAFTQYQEASYVLPTNPHIRHGSTFRG